MLFRKLGLLTGVLVLGAAAVLSTVVGADEAESRSSADSTRRPSATPNSNSAKAAISRDVDRSPYSVAVSADGRYCVSANHTSDTVSLVDLQAGRIVTEYRCGRGPVDVAWIDTTSFLVSLLHDDAVAVIQCEGLTLKTIATIPVGDEPRGVAIVRKPADSDQLAFVAVSGTDQVAVIDLKQRQVVQRISVGGQPRTLAVAPNGRWLVTCCSVPGEVFVHEIGSYKLLNRRTVFDDAFNLGVPFILADSSACIFPHPINRTFPVNFDNVEKGWAIDNRLTRVPLPVGEYWKQKQLGLDKRGDAAGDAHTAAVSPDGEWLIVTCGGSHELLIFPHYKIQWPAADPGDFLPEAIRDGDGLFRRVELAGRPLGMQFLDNRRVVIANYLLNAVQIVDVVDAKLLQTILLGGPKQPSLVRRGEAIFFDADRSFNSWFSCHTCHTDGHTSGQTFDTVNDGNYDTYKLTPSLRGVSRTGPWTWHGWQKSLSAAMRKSLRDTLSTDMPIEDEDINALLAYLGSLDHPASPHRQADGELTATAKRGEQLFRNKAGCATCHNGPDFTTNATYSIGTESPRYFYSELNPPSLRGTFAKRRFLHDGRANSLKEALSRHHRPEKLAGEALSDTELDDLIAFLKSI